MSSAETEHITSSKNQHVLYVRELLAKRSSREQNGVFIAEGVRLCEEALKSGLKPALVLFSKKCSSRGLELVKQTLNLGCKVLSVTPEVLDGLSDTETTQGMLMVMPNPNLSLPSELDFIIVIDQVRDPGNLGTILRSSAAAGIQAVFYTPGSVDAWSPKVVRSAMGAHFRIPVLLKPWKEIKDLCKHQNPALGLFLAESGEGKSLWQMDLSRPLALVIGGEAEGASQEVKEDVDTFIHIPMPGKFESLNAGVAASIILFEVVRQRNS